MCLLFSPFCIPCSLLLLFSSVAALLHAAGPPQELVEERDRLENKCRQYEKNESELKQVYDDKMRSFRQEHEQMKLMYEKKIIHTPVKSSNDSHTTSPSDSPPFLATMQLTEGEQQDDVQRRWYQKKIQDMQKKMEAQLRAAKRGPTGDELNEYKQLIKEKDRTIEVLRERRDQHDQHDQQWEGARKNTNDGRNHGNRLSVERVQALKERHDRQLMEQAEEHQATVHRLRIELRAASKTLVARNENAAANSVDNSNTTRTGHNDDILKHARNQVR